MHRRPTHHTATTASTTTTSTTATNGNHQNTLPLVSNGDAAAPPVTKVSTSFPQRKRVRRKKTAFSMHYGGSLWKDPTIRIMTAIIIILIIVICIGISIIMNLLQARNTAGTAGNHISPPTSNNKDIPLVPHSMADIGDKSPAYAQLRQSYDQEYPLNPQRSLQAVQDIVEREHPEPFEVVSNPQYDIYNCPDEPPPGYPYEWKTTTVLEEWQPDDASTVDRKIHQGLCVFDYRKDYVKALTYREKELPFVVRHDPYVAAAAERWNTPGYLDKLLAGINYRGEYSENNHFMYHTGPRKNNRRNAGITQQRQHRDRRPDVPEGWKPPTKMIHLTYAEWLKHANITDESLLGPDNPHWYFRLIGCGLMKDTPAGAGQCDPDSEYLFDELPFFQPKPGQLYLVEPEAQKGIHCRFGMKGVIAENHFDASRNAITVLGGLRRYILSHPKHCRNMALYPRGHPSARHSAVDWSDPDLEEFPHFEQAMSNEVVLQAGDVLYLPTYWFHYIISLTLNFQCNTRSGVEGTYKPPIQECGF